MHLIPRRRWRDRRRVRLALGAVLLACLSVVLIVAHQGPASTQIPMIPPGSNPEIYVAGSTSLCHSGDSTVDCDTYTGSASLPFPVLAQGDSLEAPTTTSTASTAAADTTDGTLTVVIPTEAACCSTVTATATVLNAVTTATVGSISIPQAPPVTTTVSGSSTTTTPAQMPLIAVAADPDPSHPDVVYLASGDALYVADLTGLPAVTAQLVYTLPGPDRSFSSIAVSPDGSTVYLGGDDLTPSGAPVNAIFAFNVNPGGPCSTPSGQAPLCEWDGPSGDLAFAGGITGLALTPNGRDLFAVNNAGVFSTAQFEYAFGLLLNPAATAATPATAPLPASGQLAALVRLPAGTFLGDSSITIDPSGTDVYVGSESFTANEATDAAVTGFPVASVTSNVAAANLEPTGVDPPASLVNTTILQTCPNGDSCPLFFNDQLNVSISMSADGKDLVVAMPSYQFVGVEEISEGTLLDSVPVQPNGAGQPNITWPYCTDSTVSNCTTPPAPPSTSSQFLQIGTPGSGEAIAITPDQSPIAAFTDVPGVAGTASTFDANPPNVQFGTISELRLGLWRRRHPHGTGNDGVYARSRLHIARDVHGDLMRNRLSRDLRRRQYPQHA